MAFGSSTVVVPVKPREQFDANAGLDIARTNLSGGLRFGIKDFEGARKMMRTMMGGKRMPGMMKMPKGSGR